MTTYSRDTLGRLTGVSYAGIATPGYIMTYHRDGALKTVTDGLGTRTFTPRVLDVEGKARLSLTGTTLLPEAEVTEGYDAVTGQRIGWALHLGETPVHEVGYGYTGIGLLGTVTLRDDGEPMASWAHDYAPAMARVARVQGRLGVAGPGPVHTATSFFDEHLRVEQVAHFAGTQLRQGWSYQFDPQRPQRRVGRTDMVVERPGWAWGYNGRGEVTSAQRTRSVAGAAAVAGQGWGYGYDAIGNRLQATRSTAQVAVIDMAPQDTPQTMNTTYSPNGFNQYVGITRPEALEVSGVTDPAVPEVEIVVGPDDPTHVGQSTLQLQDGQTRPVGNGEPGGYGLWVVGTESMSVGQWPLLSVTASRPGENPNDPPITQTQSGRVWVRPTEAPVHDADGNLISDGGWTYQWDAENRLISAEMKADALPSDLTQMRMEFHYDWLSRRVATVTKSKAPNSTTWSTVETRHFWYDGWNLMAETVASPPASGATGSVAVTHRYAWGVDLGGTWETGMGNHGPGRSQTTAGGVGALLGVIAPNGKTYSATQDANGNVTGFMDLESGTLAARFDYDAFGTLITDWSAPGHNAWEISRIRFSGKYQDPHTGWLYYGYRYLDTVNGRWVSRDPIGEEGGLNLYGMVGNDGVNQVDFIGLSKWNSEKGKEAIELAKVVKAGGEIPSGHCCSSFVKKYATGDCITFAAGAIRCGYLLSGDVSNADKIGAISNSDGTKVARILEQDGWALVVYARDSRRVRATYDSTNPPPPGRGYVTGEAIAGTFATAVNTGRLYGMTVAGALYDLDPTPIPGETRTPVSVPTISFAFLSATNDYHTGLLAGTTVYHSPGLKELPGGLTEWSNLYQATQIGYMMLAPDAQGSLPTFRALLDARRNYKAPKIIPP